MAKAHCCWAMRKPILQCYSAMLSRREEKNTFQTCTLPTTINSCVARRKMIDEATMMMEKRRRQSNGK